MVTTIYTTEEEKFGLLSNTINYIWNNIDPKLTENDPIKTREYFKSDNSLSLKVKLRVPEEYTRIILTYIGGRNM
jgi:hypothetical protein